MGIGLWASTKEKNKKIKGKFMVSAEIMQLLEVSGMEFLLAI